MRSDGSSESGIWIDSEGEWFYRDSKMTRQDIISIFYRHLRRDAYGGYFIEIGSQRCPVHVEDQPYVIRALRWTHEIAGQEYALLVLSDGTVEALDPETLWIGRNEIPYCYIKNRSFPARFSRPAYYKLAERVDYAPDIDAFTIKVAGNHYPVPVRG